ncbi:hypothetical protein BaRGS_00023285, partial [Batillaria attramentaria]
ADNSQLGLPPRPLDPDNGPFRGPAQLVLLSLKPGPRQKALPPAQAQSVSRNSHRHAQQEEFSSPALQPRICVLKARHGVKMFSLERNSSRREIARILLCVLSSGDYTACLVS